MSRSSREEAKETAMTFVDRYWEWRRLRALRAQGNARALETLVEAPVGRRGVARRVARRPGGRERASPVGRSSEARDRSEHDPLRTTRESPRSFERDRPDKRPSLRTEGNERTGANGPLCSTILAAVDGSAASQRVGEHAVNLAETLGARLFILGVVNKPLAFRGGIRYGDIVSELRWESRVAVDGVKRMADRSSVEYEERLVLGRPWEVIVGVAGKTGADCIVLGSSRTSPLPQTSLVDRALTGGTQRRVIRHAGRPVLIV